MHRGSLPKMPIVLIAGAMFHAGCDQRLPEAPAAVAKLSTVDKDNPTPAALSYTGSTVHLPNFTALVKSQGPAVVNISSTRRVKGVIPFPNVPGLSPDDPFYDFLNRFGWGNGVPHEFRSQSLGSGFVVDRDGHILTNAHIIEDADEVVVILNDRREFKAKVVGIDKRSDVALLKISAKNLPVVSIGDPAKLEVGEWVAAIGAPFGFVNSVTQGIVSAKGRDLPGENIVPFIQTDVAINPGSSGGPLFNLDGEVVGINSQIFSKSGGSMGISFAIPIDVAMKVKEQLLRHGTVRRGRLGVTTGGVTAELAESFGLEKAAGALIAEVEKGGPAERAGLRAGDVVLGMDGREVTSAADLARFVSEAAPGASARLNIWRNGSVREVTVKLGQADTEAAKRHTGSLAAWRPLPPYSVGNPGPAG